MWGAEMLRALGNVAVAEESALHETGVRVEDFDTPPVDVNGARRPMRLPLTEVDVEGGCDEHGTYVQLRFSLPRGAFATTVLREVMKGDGREHPWGSDSGG
jgi:tRNA pseudouridine13 synthase